MEKRLLEMLEHDDEFLLSLSILAEQFGYFYEAKSYVEQLKESPENRDNIDRIFM